MTKLEGAEKTAEILIRWMHEMTADGVIPLACIVVRADQIDRLGGKSLAVVVPDGLDRAELAEVFDQCARQMREMS